MRPAERAPAPAGPRVALGPAALPGCVASLLAAAALGVAAPAAGIQVGPGWALSEIPTGDLPVGGIAVVGGTLFVGMGAYGGADQSVVRIDGGGETVIADGFNGIAGMTYDAGNDRLIVVDNGLEAGGSETGDSLYAVASPFAPVVTPQRAVDIALLPAGSIASGADVILDPGDPDTAFVSNALIPVGQTLRVDLVGGSVTPVQSLVGFSAGLAATLDELFVGLVAFGTLDGQVHVTDLPGGGGALSPLATGLDGQFDLVLASDGTLLATSSRWGVASSVLRLSPATGAVLETIAWDFDFATVLAEEDGVIYVLEGGSSPQDHVLVLPEPSGATGLLAASGALGLLGSRRARARAAAERAARAARSRDQLSRGRMASAIETSVRPSGPG